MPGFFESISDFFFSLFSSDPNAARLRKQLRELQETVLGVRPTVWSKSSEEVLSAFPQSWYNLYGNLLPVYDLISKTVANTDKKIQTLSRQYLIESLLVGDIGARRADLSYESIKQKLTEAPSPDAAVSALNAQFNNLLTDIRRQDGESVNRDLGELMKLRNLATHNFQGFFKKFGYDLALYGKQNPKFHGIDGDSIITELLDLYYVIAGFEITVSMEKGLGLLLEKVSPSKAMDNLTKMRKFLDKIRDLMRGPCSPYLTLSLIKLIRKEPDLEPEASKIKDDFFHQYMDALAEKYAQDRDRALREFNENSLGDDIKILFPDGNLLVLEAYNEETSQKLMAAGLPPLSMVKAMQILRSFCYAVLKAYLLDCVKQVVLNGFFQDKEWAAKLSNSLYSCENTAARIEAYDHNLTLEGKNTLTALEKYLGSKAPMSNVPSQLVEKLNRGAQDLLEKEVNEIAQLALRIQEVLMDFKSPQPTNVTNIKGLGGQKHREIIQGLVEGYNKTAQLMRIMKHFVVIRGLNLSK